MPPGKQQAVELLTQGYAGFNNALQFSQLSREQSPSMKNAWQPKLGAIGKRPGSIPVTASALAADIEYLTTYKASASSAADPDIFAASGTTLYKFDGTDTLDGLTMTDALESADIYTIGFTDENLTSRLLIADGGDLKECDGSSVEDVTPASDDSNPLPANALSDINTKGIKYIWEFKGHVFVSPGTHEVFYSKRYVFDYFRETDYFFFVEGNDFVNGCGVAYDNILLIPMRRRWGTITGTNFDDFNHDNYLNTNRGVIAPRSIQKVTYPNGEQTVIFLSDDGLHEIYIAIIEGSGKLYATRSLMKDKIDFEAIGLSEAEKAAAVGHYHAEYSLYLLSFVKDGDNITYAYDLRNREFYPDWTTFSAKSYVSLNTTLYFGGTLKHLCKFDKELYSDWDDSGKSEGTAVHFQRYSPLLSLEFSGYASYWDYFLLEARQFLVPSSVNITVVFSSNVASSTGDSPWKLTVAVYGRSKYGQARYANLSYTDIVNAPNRKVFKKKARYIQVLLENNQDQPLEIYSDKWIGRASGQ